MDVARAEEVENIRVPDAFTPVVGFRRFGIPWPPTDKHDYYYLIQKEHRWTPAAPHCGRVQEAGFIATL
jgi:hypothetical protein